MNLHELRDAVISQLDITEYYDLLLEKKKFMLQNSLGKEAGRVPTELWKSIQKACERDRSEQSARQVLEF